MERHENSQYVIQTTREYIALSKVLANCEHNKQCKGKYTLYEPSEPSGSSVVLSRCQVWVARSFKRILKVAQSTLHESRLVCASLP